MPLPADDAAHYQVDQMILNDIQPSTSAAYRYTNMAEVKNDIMSKVNSNSI